jgi:hypothetical protein
VGKKGEKKGGGAGGGRLALYDETGGEFDAISYYPSCKCLNHAKHVRFLASKVPTCFLAHRRA